MSKEKVFWSKVIRPGKVDIGQQNLASLYCKITFSEHTHGEKVHQTLSISGVEGPKTNGDARGSCGQIEMHMGTDYMREFAPGWNQELFDRFVKEWREWHLNDMFSGCEHIQPTRETFMQGFNPNLLLDLYHYSTGPAYRELKEKILKGEMADNYKEACSTLGYVDTHTIWKGERLEGNKRNLIDEGFLTEELKESARSGHVFWNGGKETVCATHSLGLLGKPCPVCGKTYGGSWGYRPVPQEVLDFLQSLPDTDLKPAWV